MNMEIGSGSIETSEGFLSHVDFKLTCFHAWGFLVFVEVPQATPAAVPQQVGME